MPGGNHRLERRADRSSNCEIGHEDRRLRVARFAQHLFGSVRADVIQIVAQDVLSRREARARGRILLRDRHAHTDALRPLTGEHDADAHQPTSAADGATPFQRQATAPHERPAPNATNMMMSPSCSRFCANASDKAIGIDAAEVLP